MTRQEFTLLEKIISGEAQGQQRLDLAGFKRMYRQVQLIADQEGVQTPSVDVLLLTETALVQFETAPNFVLRIIESRPLTRTDFEIIIVGNYYGNLNPVPVRGLVWTELKKNGKYLFPVFVLFFILICSHKTDAVLETISQMLVEANALFVSIFTLFTITQNRELFASKELAATGFTHRMMRNDWFMTTLSILSLILAFVSVAIIGTNLDLVIFAGRSIEITLARLIVVLALVLLIDCLLSVTQYYLKAMHTAVESKMYRDIMARRNKE